MDDLYKDNILDHYRNPRNFGHLKSPDITWEENNLVCGDRIGMEVQITRPKADKPLDKKITINNITFYGEGCAISIASASMLTQLVKGKTKDEIRKITPDTIKTLLGISPSPARLKCALLPLETLVKTLDLVK